MSLKHIIYLSSICLLFLACEKAFITPAPSEEPEQVFETFWQLVDENYCLFEEKQVDWQALYDANRSKITNENTVDAQLKRILEEMLAELKDGHVNLRTPTSRSRFDYTEGFPRNFDRNVLYRNYLNNNPALAEVGALLKAVIDSVIYIRIPSFGSLNNGSGVDLNPDIMDDEFDAILAEHPNTKGLIIDVRENGGGNTGNPDAILARFIDQPTLAYHLRPKNGPNRNDFGPAAGFNIEPRAPQYLKKVVLLTNRASYSATNYFASIMKNIPDNVTVIGGKTGGGGGLPTYKDLPNGWLLRLSVTQLLDLNQQQIEGGIEPDINVELTDADIEKGKDTILEFALGMF